MKANGKARGRRDDGGQLLLLAGIVLALAFILTAVTLDQLANLPAQTTAGQRAPILDEFRFIRGKVNSTLGNLVTPTTSNSSLNETFSSLAGSYTALEAQKGYDLVMVLAGSTQPTIATERGNFTTLVGTARVYSGTSFDGQVNFANEPYDGVNDGILWYNATADSFGRIHGIVVHLYLADQTMTLQETILYALNT